MDSIEARSMWSFNYFEALFCKNNFLCLSEYRELPLILCVSKFALEEQVFLLSNGLHSCYILLMLRVNRKNSMSRYEIG